MIDLQYALTIEATDDPAFFSFYSTELEGFTGVGHSVEDCLCTSLCLKNRGCRFLGRI